MLSTEKREAHARRILHDLMMIDPKDDAQRLDAVQRRIGAALLEGTERAPLPAVTLDPTMRRELLEIYCALAGAIGRQPETWHEVKGWRSVFTIALEAHRAFLEGVDDVGKPAPEPTK